MAPRWRCQHRDDIISATEYGVLLRTLLYGSNPRRRDGTWAGLREQSAC